MHRTRPPVRVCEVAVVVRLTAQYAGFIDGRRIELKSSVCPTSVSLPRNQIAPVWVTGATWKDEIQNEFVGSSRIKASATRPMLTTSATWW